MSQGFAIKTHSVTKTIAKKNIIKDLNLEIPEGAIYGFLGPNGSGKTTTMKMLLGLSKPTTGYVEIYGQKLSHESSKKLTGKIGGLIEEPPGYGQLTGEENLNLVGKLLDLPKENISWSLNKVGLTANKDKKVSHYSLGMKQRLGIALAIVSRPKLLILDEPINGLDPAGIEEMRNLFQTLAQEGTTIMISSHILAEIEKISTHFGIITQGKLIYEGKRDELIDSYANSLFVRTPDVKTVRDIYPDAKFVQGGVVVPSVLNNDINDLCYSLMGNHVRIHEITRQQESLEDIFMRITAGDNDG